MDTTFIARVAHEADRTLAAINGDMTVGGWPNLQAWQRASQISGVQMAIDTPGADAEALHESWRRDKLEAGWSYSGAFDRARKTDPMLMPWAQLTPLQRRREMLFVAIIRSLSPDL